MVLLFLCGACRHERPQIVVIGVKADAQQINPVTHVTAFERILCSGILPRLLESEWDSAGVIHYSPSWATRWEFSDDGKTLTYHLRGDWRWSDGHPLSAHDVQSTFRKIRDSSVASTKKEHLLMLDLPEGADISQAVEIVDDSTIAFHFREAYPLAVFDTNLQPGFLPSHIVDSVSDVRRHWINSKPLSGGPFRLVEWKRQEQIVLERNSGEGFQTVIFRVIPEYTTRLSSFQTGEIDVMYPVSPQDVDRLRAAVPDCRIELMRYRYYDYVGWQNIDAELYRTSKHIRPHRLFGSRRVRQALTMAIPRQEIIDGYFDGTFAEVAVSPISPMFRWALHDSLQPWPYDPTRAREWLAQEGWQDHDGDGVLDRDGVPFAFDLVYDAGNERRAFAASVIEKGLRAVGIRVAVRTVETNVFYDDEMNKKYDAFISGIGVPLQIDPTSEWHSDLARYPYNDVSYQNAEVDRLLAEGKRVRNVRDAAPIWRRFQEILHEDQPATFLYWRHEIIAFRGRVGNTQTSPLGEIDKFWLWR